jgi:hypothetical protein
MLAEGSSSPPEIDDLSVQTNLPNSSITHATANSLPPNGRKRKRPGTTVIASSPAPSDPGSASGNLPELAFLFYHSE